MPIKDEWQYIKDGEGKSNVEYYQNNICMITTYSTSDLSDIANDEIRKFEIWIDEDDIIKGDYPICINGVTIGSDYDEIHEKLGFEPSETGNPDSNTKGIFTVRGYTDNYRVLFQGANLKVKHISILNQK